MKLARFLSLSTSAVLLSVSSVSLSSEAAAQQANPNQKDTGPVDGQPDSASLRRRKSAKEKEYSELARKIREADQEFEKKWRSAGSHDRQKMRNQRIQKLQPTLARMNQLAIEIRNERTTLKGDATPVPVPLDGPVKLSDEINGKSREELLQMGVAETALPPAASTKPGSSPTAASSATR